jgi:predicted small lipoprotein YifL
VKNKMKKILSLILTFALVLSLTACGESSNNNTPSEGNTSTQSSTPDNGNTVSSTSEASAPDGGNKDDVGNLADCLAQFGLTEADITPADPAEINSTVLKEEFFRADIPVNAMPEADAIRAFVEQVYTSTKNAADDGKVYVSQDKNDLENTRPLIEFTLDEEDFTRTGKTRWGYDYNGTRYFVSLSYEYKSRELTQYLLQIKYDWYS